MSAEPVVVWGAGAIGGTIGAHLIRAGHAVLFVDREAQHVAALAQGGGCRITGPLADFRVPAPALTPDRVEGPLKTVLLCVKAQDTAAATASLAPHLDTDGCVVSVQNGLNELVIAERVGTARTVGCFVNFGADYIEPGVIHYGGRGTVVLGEIDGSIAARTKRLHALLCDFDDRAILSPNVFGYLWSKLAYGAVFATALTDAPIADVLASQPHRPILIALAREVVAVAKAQGIRLEPFDGFDPGAFAPEAGAAVAARSLDELVAFNRRSAKTHSGVWRDIAVRRRPTEAEAQLGPIARLAREQDQQTPLVARLITLVRELETRKRAQGWDVLDALAAREPGASLPTADA